MGCVPQPLTITPEPVELRIAVAEPCGPLAEDLAVAYQAMRPWATRYVETFNASVVEDRLRSGAADLAISFPLDELDVFWVAPFATDAIVVIAHPAIPVEALGMVELREAFRGRIGEWADGTPIQVVSREAGAGSRTVFEAAVMEGYDIALTALVVPDSAGMLSVVESTPGAIGYISLVRLDGRVHPIRIDALPFDLVEPGVNPFAYEMVLATLGEPRDEGRTFIQWVLSPSGQQVVMRHFGPSP